MLLCREDEWNEEEIEFIKHLSSTIGHAFGSLQKTIVLLALNFCVIHFYKLLYFLV